MFNESMVRLASKNMQWRVNLELDKLLLEQFGVKQ